MLSAFDQIPDIWSHQQAILYKSWNRLLTAKWENKETLLTTIFIPKTPQTKLSGMKKNASWVSFVTVSASVIALRLSTMLIVDIIAWNVESTRLDVVSRSCLTSATVILSLTEGFCQDFPAHALPVGSCLVFVETYPREAIWCNKSFLHGPNWSRQVCNELSRTSSSEMARSIWSRLSLMSGSTCAMSFNIIWTTIFCIVSSNRSRISCFRHLFKSPINRSLEQLSPTKQGWSSVSELSLLAKLYLTSWICSMRLGSKTITPTDWMSPYFVCTSHRRIRTNEALTIVFPVTWYALCRCVTYFAPSSLQCGTVWPTDFRRACVPLMVDV